MHSESEILLAIKFIQQNTHIPVTVNYNLPSRDELIMWPGIRLCEGALEVNPKIAHAGDLLHEAGHLATLPERLRELANGEMGASEEFCLALSENPSLYSGDDDAATYWAFAACRKIGISDSLPFEKGYEGDKSEDYLLSARMGIGSSMGSRFSVQLYYAGLLKSKGDEFPYIWDILDLEENREAYETKNL